MWKTETYEQVWLRLTPVEEGQGPLWLPLERVIYFQTVGEVSKVVFAGANYGPVDILVRETEEQFLQALRGQQR